MKIDFSQHMTDFEDQPIVQGDRRLTLGFVAASALNATDDTRAPTEDALERGMLAFKVYNQGEIEISPEDVTLIRKVLPLTWAPMIVAQAHNMLGG